MARCVRSVCAGTVNGCMVRGCLGYGVTGQRFRSGMHADSDGDGSPDCEEACPFDANKVVPGICGCGKVDQTPCV